LSRVSKLRTVPYFWWLFAIVLLLSGCATENRNSADDNNTSLNAFGPLTHNSQWYLTHIDSAAPEDHFALQVLATRSLIADGDRSQANAIQQQLTKEAITPRQKVALRLLNALQLGKQGQSSKALNRIAGIDLRPLDSNTVQYYYRLQSDLLLKTGQKTASANSLISLDAYLSGEAANKNHQQIWQLLQDSDSKTLQTYVNAANRMKREKAAGWYELAQIAKDPSKQTSQYEDWKKHYPDHPATALFTPAADAPKQPSIAENNNGLISTAPIQKIAVLLPLSGKLASPANALKAGLEQANIATGNKLAFSYYDENSQSMPELLAQAENNGAQLIVGPLQKNKLEQLVASHTSVPVLALNQLDGQPAADNLYYFSLSPENEAAQIAQKINEDGMKHPLLLLPSNALGDRTATGFNSYWKSLDTGDADVAKFRSRDELLSLLRQKLGGKASALQAGQVQSLAEDPASQPDHVDSIYMLASAFEASSIKSSVDMMLGNSPVRPTYYLGSKSNNGAMKPDVALALNGMQLGDMPWMLNRMPDQLTKATTALPQASGDQLRLYAMGYDVSTLVPQLSALREDPEAKINGLTGVLHVTTDGVILHDLLWTRYTNGQLTNDPAPQPVAAQPAQ
jgi:uncharacterized protein